MRYSGRVQGVGFRFTCCWIASSHAVTGWVRNEQDGGVTLEAQGAPEAVEGFLGAVAAQMGSKIATSDKVPAEVIPGEAEFEVLR